MNYCGRRSWLLVRIFKVFGMKLGAFMFLLGGSKYFSMWWLNFFNVYLNEQICSSRASHNDRRGRSQNLLSRDKCDERKIKLFCFKIYHTFSLISKKGSIKLKLNNDLNCKSNTRVIDTRTSLRLPWCTPLSFIQGSLKSSFARTWNEKVSVNRYFTRAWYSQSSIISNLLK